MTTAAQSADDIIKELDLAPHPEGGWYRRTFEDP
ncbi:MAG: cupin domain-containing protein, partial [Pseudomonadota bacterium]